MYGSNFFKIYTDADDSIRQSNEFKKQISKEVGDILWYLANLASFYKLRLDFVAFDNLEKIRTIHDLGKPNYFDKNFPSTEKFPRKFRIKFVEEKKDGQPFVNMYMNGKILGNTLDDNAQTEDYYRFHDVFHLAYVAILGWSPTIRKLLNRK